MSQSPMSISCGIVPSSESVEQAQLAEELGSAEAEAMGTTEIIHAPSGPDLARELRVFAEAAGL